MDDEIARILHAVNVASNPLNQNKSHQVEAVNYLQEVQQNAYRDQVWSLALSLFIEQSQDASARKYDPQTRLFALRILDEFLDNKFTPLDDPAFATLKSSFMNYIESEYIRGPAEASATFLRNKFSHTFTLFFLCTYQHQWQSFFLDLFSLIRTPPPSSSTSSSLPPNLNIHISLLFFRIILEISGEISDQILKSARAFHPERHVRDGRVRDLVRERDAAGLNAAVVGIITECMTKLTELRPKYAEFKNDVDTLDELVDWGIRAFASYIHWIDISLTCSPTTIQMLFSLLSGGPHIPGSLPTPAGVRLGTVSALQRMIGKGLKEPNDKLDLLRVLDLGKVLDALEVQTRECRSNLPPELEEGEEQFRESLGRLLSALGQELLELSKEEVAEQIRLPALQLIEEIIPVTLRFLADEYDDTTSTTFPFIHGLLQSYKRSKKSNPTEPLGETKQAFLRSLIEILLEKLKWSADDDDPFDMDEDDKSHFEVLRRDIKTFLEAINALEPDMIVNSLCNFAMNILKMYETGSPMLTWQHLELAAYLTLIFGEVNKGPTRGRYAFCIAPPGTTTPSKTDNSKARKELDFSQLPLTPQGQLMVSLINSGVIAFPHPSSIVAMQIFEVAVKYPDFFRVRKECAPPILEAMVDERGIHHNNSAVRSRAFYLLHRFIKDQKAEITPELASVLLSRVADTLVVDSSLPTDEAEVSSDAGFSEIVTELATHATSFDSQSYMFEAAGTLLSLLWRTTDTQQAMFRSLIAPILDEMQLEIQAARSTTSPDPRDPAAVLTVVKLQRNIISLGQIAKGFPDYPPNPPPGYILPPIPIFQQCVEAIMISLDAMSRYKIIREAARSSFSKILAPTGVHITPYIPDFMSRLIVHSEPSELTEFIQFISLLVHKLQGEMAAVLEELHTPLYTHINSVLSQLPNGAGPVGTTLVESKRAYLHLLNSIISSSLVTILTSERNMPHLESLLQLVMQMAADCSDPTSQKGAFTFLGRSVAAWAQPSSETRVPGLERFTYDHLIPLIFKVPSMPQFNIKDGQVVTTCHEIANTLQVVCKTRGQEAYDYLATVFFPGVQCPPETAAGFITQLRELDSKAFRKYFTDFVRLSRVAQ